MVHMDDLVGACLHLIRHDDAGGGRAFNVASGVYPTSLEVAEVLAGEFEMALEPSDDPDCGMSYEERREVRDGMLAEGMADDILLSKERFRFMRKVNRNNRLSIDALLGTGFEPRETDVPASISRNVAWYREHRWIL
jgi:nucleoside-diphosphate-sugar epimerase